jgi:phosphoglycolate phosphatase
MTALLHGIEAIAFDLDGTLVDSAPDIQQALNAALTAEGLARFDLATVRAWIGDGPDALILRALAQHAVRANDGLRGRLRRRFDDATLAAPLQFGHVFGGVAASVAGLQALLPLVVVTNKPTLLARAVLQAAGLLPAMAAVYGADTKAQRKPAPLMLQAAAQQLGLAPAQLLMVGDGPADLRAAQAAGVPAALVDWGYGGAAAEAMAAETACWRVATPQQLLAAVQAARDVGRETATAPPVF